jgi:hypothetical protein
VAGSKAERFLNEEESKMSFKRIACAAVGLCAVVLMSACSSKDRVSLTHIVDLTHTLSGKFPIVPVPGLTFPFD